ncbi:hypothetical protein J3R30DRAFT_170644 [Lentinula aciculospora]|uniref:Zn(2)-C6 fungal-type domain-containing protein n=1 Tax=Lentinula aciculospora TaxID=153920 RepID=A0A9W9A8S8_9AGAR|nr:hypothetical protein J3R30DRAFT_170644 [Lentinula aciculospora]
MYSKKTPHAPPISRGGACNNCKRRKMRCDGRTPICGPCIKTPSLGDCEYADIGRTHADRLQEQISILETRLGELQNRSDVNNSITLHNPYALNALSSSSRHRLAEKDLMEAFLPYASHLSFFLNGRNLVNMFSNPRSEFAERPTIALSSSMVLIGAYFRHHVSQNPNITSELVEGYLSKAIQTTSVGLSESHPHQILHTIQSHILIAQYFFLLRRALEGKWHLNKAVSLVLSARMHRIRSSLVLQNVPATSAIHATTWLPAAQNTSEEVEQINAMWNVLAMNCLWSAMEGVPASIAYTTDQGRVDTPWPLDTDNYSNATFPPNLQSSHTLQKFLAGFPDEGYSILALYVKAAVLFEQTTMFWKRYSNNAQAQALTRSLEFHGSYRTLYNLLTDLLNKIPPIRGPHEAKTRLLVIHTLVRVAIIRLQCTLGADNPSNQSSFLDMANGIIECLGKIDLDSTVFLDPIMAVILRAPATIFIRAIKLFRSPTIRNAAELQKYSDGLNQLMHILARYSMGNPLMALKSGEIQGEYESELSH